MIILVTNLKKQNTLAQSKMYKNLQICFKLDNWNHFTLPTTITKQNTKGATDQWSSKQFVRG